MANEMNPKNYSNMIQALRNFAAKTTETTSELSSACASCAQTLGEKDIAGQNLASHADKISSRYAALAGFANSIANAMQEELDEFYNNGEGKNWSSDSGDGDDDF